MNPVKRCSLFHVLAGAIALAAGPACAQQVYKWNMPTPYADGSFHTKNTRMFADEVRSASNGRIDITVHSNGSLFKLPEIKRAVQTGQVPIAETNLPALPASAATSTAAARQVPTEALNLYSRGLLYEDQGDRARAIEYYERALVAFPDFSEARDALRKLRGA